MVLKTFKLEKSPEIAVKPLTISGFEKFGSIVSPDEEVASRDIAIGANYGTAIKITKVAHPENNFDKCESKPRSQANLNIFRCFPPKKQMEQLPNGGLKYTGKVLERHPFSSQTFIPMGRTSSKIGYVVVCALNDESGMPDLSTIEAFACKSNQAVTYGPGTWHAPMIAISKEHEQGVLRGGADDYIDFTVMIYENGVADDDCQECYIDPGYVLTYR